MLIQTDDLAEWQSPDSDIPLRIGNGVTAPKIVYKVEQLFTLEARDTKLQGTVLLSVVVGRDGVPSDVIRLLNATPAIRVQIISRRNNFLSYTNRRNIEVTDRPERVPLVSSRYGTARSHGGRHECPTTLTWSVRPG